jgi:MFS transporter, DHA1 family, multidrug resistance protein B
LKSNYDSIDEKTAGKRINAIAASSAFSALAFSITFPFLPIYLHTIRGFPMSIAGLVFPAMGLAAIVGSPVAGILTDKFGSQKVMVLGPFLRSIAFFGVAYATSIDAPFYIFVIGLFLTSFFGCFFENGSNSYLTELIEKEDRTIAISRVRVMVNLGFLLGPAIGSFMASTPFSLLFAITGSLCFFMAFLPLTFCTRLSKKKGPNRGENSGDIKETNKISILYIFRTNHLFTAFLFFTFLLQMAEFQFISILSIYATKIVGISKNSLGFLYTLNGVVVLLFLIPMSRLLKNTNLFMCIGFGAFFYAAGYWVWGISDIWIHLAIGVFVMTIGENMSNPTMISVTGKLADPEIIGRYMGLFGLSQGIARGIGPFLGAQVFDKYSGQPLLLWQILSLPAVIGGCGFLMLGFFNRHKI